MRQARGPCAQTGAGTPWKSQSKAVSDTEAGRQLRDLANGEHRYVKAGHWQASVFWERAEERMMHRIGSEALALCSRTPLYSRLESESRGGVGRQRSERATTRLWSRKQRKGSVESMTPEQARPVRG